MSLYFQSLLKSHKYTIYIFHKSRQLQYGSNVWIYVPIIQTKLKLYVIFSMESSREPYGPNNLNWIQTIWNILYGFYRAPIRAQTIQTKLKLIVKLYWNLPRRNLCNVIWALQLEELVLRLSGLSPLICCLLQTHKLSCKISLSK